MRAATLVLPAVLAVVTAASCSGDESDGTNSTEATVEAAASAPPTTIDPSTASTSAPTASSSPIDAASTTPPSTAPSGADAARRALDDVVGWIADPSTVVADRFAEAFLEQVPATELVTIFESLGGGDWAATDVVPAAPGALTATITGPPGSLIVQLAVDIDGRIESLLLQPSELADPPSSLAELTERLDAAAPITGFVAAEVEADGSCRAVEGLRPDAPLPIGSVFKLYVLGAVAAAVAGGDITWDQPVTIRDELDSLPSGTTQDEPAGSTLTVRQLARRMISISDNTATDHLIDLVGRDRVEAALGDLGHSDPSANLPFPTTRELFVLKADPGLLDRYAAADESGRRVLLDTVVSERPLPDDLVATWTEPRAVTTVEWFASPADICRALVELDDLAADDALAPVRAVLSENPGVAVDPEAVTRVLFKGGSEPGVLFLGWLATRSDGSRVAVVGGAANDAASIDPTVGLLLAEGVALSTDR